MRDWHEKLDAFLQFNEREILQDAGKVSTEVAKTVATEHNEKFNERRLLQESQEADEFDDAAKRIEEEGKEDKR